MRQLRIAAALLAAVLVSCVAFAHPSRYYVTALPQTYSDSTVDSVFVHIDERVLIESNARLLLGRREHLEQGACLRIARREGRQIWVDSTLSAAVDAGMTTSVQISFTCWDNQIPWHAHVVYERDGWDQCKASDNDRAPALAVFPAELISCGVGIDSIIAYRVRRR